jgi:hypothetical protein
MKVGDKVRMSPMWKYDEAFGEVIKITKDYTVVKWKDVNGEAINGEWHYTQDQSKELEVL